MKPGRWRITPEELSPFPLSQGSLCPGLGRRCQRPERLRSGLNWLLRYPLRIRGLRHWPRYLYRWQKRHNNLPPEPTALTFSHWQIVSGKYAGYHAQADKFYGKSARSKHKRVKAK